MLNPDISYFPFEVERYLKMYEFARLKGFITDLNGGRSETIKLSHFNGTIFI